MQDGSYTLTIVRLAAMAGRDVTLAVPVAAGIGTFAIPMLSPGTYQLRLTAVQHMDLSLSAVLQVLPLPAVVAPGHRPMTWPRSLTNLC